jgi:hypothetical protein
MAKQAQGTALPFKVPTNKEQLIAWLDAKRKLGKPVVSESQMKLNLAYVLSFQWISWDQQRRAYVKPRIDTSDPNAPIRLTANKIAPLLERLVAKVTKDAPEAECRPVSDDDDDVSAARVGTRILGSENNRLDWPSWLQQFMFSPGITGFAYAHAWWNPDDGDKIDTGDTDTDDDGDDDAVFEGNICLDIVPAFELSVDPSAKTMKEAKWCVRTTHMTRETAWERWGVELPGGDHRSLSSEVMDLGNANLGTVSGRATDQWVRIHQFWMVPCRAAPKGLVVTWAAKEVIEEPKNFPYDHGQLPFVQCNWLSPLEGMREGRTIVTDLVPLQTDYNDSLSRAATIRRQLTPKLLAPAGSIDPNRVTSRVEVISYNPTGTAPQWLEPNSAWAVQFDQGMARDDADMADRAGINDATAGKSGASAPAAAILALQGADDTKLSITVKEMATFIQNLGWQILMLARQYWAEERTIRVWSSENVLEAYRYLGSDIDEQLDVHLSAESALPKSKTARAQLYLELAARYPQLITGADLIRLLDMPDTDFITKSDDSDTKKQYREIGQLLAGENPEVKPWDNHLIHLTILNNFRKSADYENLDEEGQARFDAHAAVHEMLVLKQLGIVVPPGDFDPNAAAQSQQVAGGPAGGAPQPGVTSPFLLDPMHGQPGDPQSGGGLAPLPLAKAAGIGQQAGQPGRVPGVPVDNQASTMGN